MMSYCVLVALLACGMVRAHDPSDAEAAKTRIAFSAALVTDTDWTIQGPHTEDKTLLFQKVVTNAGNAYSPETGVFTAPMKGMYYFQLTGVAGSTGELNAGVKKNSENMFAIYQKAGTQASATNGMFLELEQGDRVFAQLWAGMSIADQSRLSTFSGYLVFPM